MESTGRYRPSLVFLLKLQFCQLYTVGCGLNELVRALLDFGRMRDAKVALYLCGIGLAARPL